MHSFFVNICGYRICNQKRWFHRSTHVQGRALAHSILLLAFFKSQLKVIRGFLCLTSFETSGSVTKTPRNLRCEFPLYVPTPIKPCKDCKISVELYFIFHFGR